MEMKIRGFKFSVGIVPHFPFIIFFNGGCDEISISPTSTVPNISNSTMIEDHAVSSVIIGRPSSGFSGTVYPLTSSTPQDLKYPDPALETISDVSSVSMMLRPSSEIISGEILAYP